MASFHNPALSEESRNEPARIIPFHESEPLLEWLKRKDRLFKSNESHENHVKSIPGELDDIIDLTIYELDEEEESDLED
jgi:hypothetical protein